MPLVWFRSDLRLTDNTALLAALATKEPVSACYVYSPNHMQNHAWSGRKRAFVRHHLQALTNALAQQGIALTLIPSEHTVKQWQDVLNFAHEHQYRDIYFNDDYGLHEQARDQQLMLASEKIGIHCHRYADKTLISPGSLLSKSHSPYNVYTPFRKAAETRIPRRFDIVSATETGKRIKAIRIPPFADEEKLDIEQWPVGEEHAQSRLRHFVEHAVHDYKEARDRPDQDGTSRLSAYLNIGVLSVRQVWNACGEIRGDGAQQYRNELLWREFYIHLLALYPRLSKHKPFKEETDKLPWRHDVENFQRWCNGHTGVPIVDAAMRCLKATGWMHNRLRMIVASFLCKNLFIDWRWGERYFLEQLIDGDFAANNGGWQWSASTGTDSAPYFRVFNPVTQGERFDPEGLFVRYWVPELKNESASTIHNVGARSGYPEAMVDLKRSRQLAIDYFKQLKAFETSTSYE